MLFITPSLMFRSYLIAVRLLLNHMFAKMPAPANNAATSMAPVFMGIANPELELEAGPPAAPPLPPAVVEAPPAPPAPPATGVGPVPTDAVGAGTPDVSGSSVALEAPEYATACVEADGSGVALVAFGFRTLKTCERRS